MKKTLKMQLKKYCALLSNNLRLFFIIGMLLLLVLEIYFLPLLVLLELNLVIGLYVLIKFFYNRYYKNTKLFQLEAELKIPVLGFVENIKNKIIFRFRVLNEAKKRKLYLELIGHIIVLLGYLIILKFLRSYISVLVGIGLVINLIGRIRSLWYILGLNEIGLLVNPFFKVKDSQEIKEIRKTVFNILSAQNTIVTPEKGRSLEYGEKVKKWINDKNSNNRVNLVFYDQFRNGAKISKGMEQFNNDKDLIVNKNDKLFNGANEDLFIRNEDVTIKELCKRLDIDNNNELEVYFKQLNKARSIIKDSSDAYSLEEINLFISDNNIISLQESTQITKELIGDYKKFAEEGTNSYYLTKDNTKDTNLPTRMNEMSGVAYKRATNPDSNVYNLDSSGVKFWEKNKKETPDILVTDGDSTLNSYSLEQKNKKTEEGYKNVVDNPESLRNKVRERGISGTLIFGPSEIQETVLGKEASEDKKLAPHKVDDPEFIERMVENYQRGNPHRNLDTNKLLENSKKEQEIRKNENNGNQR